MPEKVYTTPEAARYLSLAVQTLINRRHRQLPPAYEKDPHTRAVTYRHSALVRFATEHGR